mmetsp:Transcript_18532/g.27749  ORF Transcript_18532/g.27749 Transcript_18532/m.27749 type:complete len:125 (+) Transcript_18532:166-540(+)
MGSVLNFLLVLAMAKLTILAMPHGKEKISDERPVLLQTSESSRDLNPLDYSSIMRAKNRILEARYEKMAAKAKRDEDHIFELRSNYLKSLDNLYERISDQEETTLDQLARNLTRIHEQKLSESY